MDLAPRLARLRYRAWHRGTREADYLIGGFFDRYHHDWDEAALAWFEALVEQEDDDVLAWALGKAEAPERFAGELMQAMQRLDYVRT